VAAASAACTTSARALVDECAGEPVLGVGLAVTVGNSPDGSVGETPGPEIPSWLMPGGKLTEELGIGVLAVTTTSEAVPLKDRAPEAVALAEMRTSPPTVALDRTRTLTSSSTARSTGKDPTAHVAPFG
jgi:hypothetical protein